jgi:hypothetical protein
MVFCPLALVRFCLFLPEMLSQPGTFAGSR